MDFGSAALRAVSTDNPWAPALAFAAGAAASIGPCVAPRFIAIAALTVNGTILENATVAASFVAGLVAAYMLFAVGGSFMWRAFQHSSEIYAVGAALMAAAGLLSLTKSAAKCAHPQPRRRRPAGSIFLLGASSAMMLSPCCTPVVLAALAYVATTGLWFSCVVLACFALGHALPVSLMAIGSGAMRTILASRALQNATRMIGGSLMLALAGYYAVLA